MYLSHKRYYCELKKSIVGSLSNIEQRIIDVLHEKTVVSSKEIHGSIGLEVSYATVKRLLTTLINQNLIVQTGQGKATKYHLSKTYELIHPINIEEYFKKEIDERKIKKGFNHELMLNVLYDVILFTQEEITNLNTLQQTFRENIAHLTPFEFTKELERLAIDLSWKSSQIEGNTYSLLETERLLKDKETASGKTKDEATMLLNHKEALDFIIEHPSYIEPINVSRIEDIHSILMKQLNVDRNIRKRRVGITGTNYTPLDNEFQIRESLENMCQLINKQDNVFSKALLVLVLISYIQPFADGNKRTARIVSNAILMNHGYCPISFRTVDAVDYKKAMLVFYELNNIQPFKQIFMEQFSFAVRTYF